MALYRSISRMARAPLFRGPQPSASGVNYPHNFGKSPKRNLASFASSCGSTILNAEGWRGDKGSNFDKQISGTQSICPTTAFQAPTDMESMG